MFNLLKRCLRRKLPRETPDEELRGQANLSNPPLKAYGELPSVAPIKPARAAEFIADELCEIFPRTGILPGEGWLEFDIVHIWDLGPIDLDGRAFRHPNEDLIRISLETGENLFLLPERGNSQMEAIGRHLRGGKLIAKDRHNGWTLLSRPKRDTYRVSCVNNSRVVLTIEVFDPLKEQPSIHIRATLFCHQPSTEAGHIQ